MLIDLSGIKNSKKKPSRSRSRSRSLSKENNSYEILDKIEKQIPLYIDENSKMKAYYERDWERKKGIRHWGQRKLFITELFFLTKYQNLGEVVIYAGAAPGNHIPFLTELFPQLKFILVDPNKFMINENDKIKIINEYFTDQMCEDFQKQYQNILFISDIRTADFKIMKTNEHEETIQKDNQLQANWVNLMKPKKAMIKFRCPYSGKLNIQSIKMLEGEIYIQPWAPQSSTETRLICDASSKWIDYEIKKYEDQMFYHNDVTRIEIEYNHFIKGEGLKKDYDSTADLIQLYHYLKQSKKFQKYPMMKRLQYFSEEITKKLNCNRQLGTPNKPKDQRRNFEERDHRIFYNQINKKN